MEKEKVNKILHIVSMVLCVILVPIIIFNSLMIVNTYTNPNHIPEAFGVSPVVVLSDSMEPTFSSNALIFIKNVDAEDLEVGDAICFLQNGTAITHRIIEISTDGGELVFATQGDGNNVADSVPVYASQIEGKYISHIAGLGAFVLFAQTTAGIIILIGVPVIAYLAFSVWKSSQDKKSEEEKRKALEAELARLRSQENQTNNNGQ